jgi:hypothetical protein
MTAASIRSNNPGAMWGKGNPIATKWGATSTEALADGLGQGNNIAHFPDPVHGAAAQFDLWHQHYAGMTLRAAITRWSGGNWSQPYADFLTKNTGLSMDNVITDTILAGPSGVLLMQYQARWEAGQPYPLTTAQWQQAQVMVFGESKPVVAAAVRPNPTVEFAISVPTGVNISVIVNGKTVTL